MPYISDIIKLIDEKTAEPFNPYFNHKRFTGMQLYGIANQCSKDKKTFPSTDISATEKKMIIPDDKYPLQIYHRVLSKSISLSDKKFQYGSLDRYQDEITNVKMVVIADQRKIEMNAVRLEELIQLSFYADLQSKAAQLEMANLKILVDSVDFDNNKVASSEFQGIDNLLKPYTLMFSINYRIECRYDKHCISHICTDC